MELQKKGSVSKPRFILLIYVAVVGRPPDSGLGPLTRTEVDRRDDVSGHTVKTTYRDVDTPFAQVPTGDPIHVINLTSLEIGTYEKRIVNNLLHTVSEGDTNT